MRRVELAVTTLAIAVAFGGAAAFGAGAVSPHGDGQAVSLAAFEAMDPVLTGPQCQNCHTLTNYPRQGDDRHRHRLNVMRGPDGRGAPGLACGTCHGDANNPASGVPGARDWRLAPLAMGWEGLSSAERCRHLKDPAHNGHRTGAAVIDHLQTSLVTWAWSPGMDAGGRPRSKPAVSYAEFMRAARTWVKTGEACPTPIR